MRTTCPSNNPRACDGTVFRNPMDLKASKRHDPIRRRRVVVPALMFLICWGASTASASALQAPIRLISPGNYEHLYSDSVAFQWMHRPVRPDSIHHYEIQFWAPRQFFRLRRRLSDLRSETGYFQYPVSALRGTFRRHGRYYWRVSVVDLEGRIRSSETRSFFIPAPELSEELNPWYFPCEIRWLSVRPVQTQAYRDFLEGIEPAAYLEAHSNLGLVFRQDRLLKQRLHLTEQVFFHSRIGLGGEISAQLRLVRNRFFTFFPESGFQLSKFSTGIGPYATLQYEACLGGRHRDHAPRFDRGPGRLDSRVSRTLSDRRG